MKRLAYITALLFIACGAWAQQAEAPQTTVSPEELRAAIAALQQARTELQQSQKQVQELRHEVEELKAKVDAQTIPPVSAEAQPQAPAAPAAEEQQVTEARIQELDQKKVESGSKYSVKFSGLILFNAFTNIGFVNNQDVPNLALNRPPGSSGGDFGATLRQTLMGIQATGPTIAGARTSASVDWDFFGGFPNTLDGSALGIVRLRTGDIRFDWQKWSLSFGQQQPFMTPLSPTSLAAIGTPSLGYSGNLWAWTPQMSAKRTWSISDRTDAALQFGWLDPLSGQLPAQEYLRKPDAGELSRVPAFAVRQSFTHNNGATPIEFGVGGYVGRQDYGIQGAVTSWAATLDWTAPLGNKFEWSGEFFRGRAIGGLWGGVGTSVVFTEDPTDPLARVVPVNAIGGWSQLKFKPAQKWEFNAAFGEDNPFAQDVERFGYGPYSPVLRNWTTMVNVIQHLRSNVLWSVEYRHLNTVPFSGMRATADHVNIAVGYKF